MLVPLAGDAQRFAGRSVRGSRYLVVEQAPHAPAPTGALVELLLQQSAAPVDTAALFACLYQGYRTGQPAAGAVGTGTVLFYSADYQYATGRRFVAGVVQPGAVRLGFQDRSAATAAPRAGVRVGGKVSSPTYVAPICMDLYQVMGDGSWMYVTSTGDCSNLPPPPSDGGGVYGGQGDGGWGGDGGGTGPGGHGGITTGTTSPQTVDSKLPPCADMVLSNLLSSAIQSGAADNILDAILTALQMPNSKVSIHFVTDNTLACNVSGDCRYNNTVSYHTGINDFTVRLNSAYLTGAATDLFIAQTILHETLHAALMDWALTHGSSVNGVSFDALLANFMTMQGLTPSDGQGQHDAMSLLVDKLGGALYNYYASIDHSGSLGAQNSQYTSVQDCTNLCWTGLENTVGYQWAVSQDSNFKLGCDAIHGAELTGQWVATGNQAAGTLQQRYPAGKDPCP